jgi:predicted ribosomally synthesized peptide with nif11-like leader
MIDVGLPPEEDVVSDAAAAAFLKAVDEDADLRRELLSAVGNQPSSGAPIVAFASRRGFAFTERELHEAATAGAGGELSDDQLGAVAGGTMRSQPPGVFTLSSVISVTSAAGSASAKTKTTVNGTAEVDGVASTFSSETYSVDDSGKA